MAKNTIKHVLSFDLPEDFQEEFRRSEFYKTIRDDKTVYASTTFPRVVPYYKDGLIEVYRKCLWDMYKSKLVWVDKNHVVKSASIVGDVIGHLHPHGDASTYQAMVTLAQDYTNNQPLIFGSGNWGNVLGDPAAAYRYTECCLSDFFCDVIEDIRPEIVDFVPNFDETEMEPDYIPFKIPILLINGSYGIADSYITSVPCHSVGDVADLCIKYVKDKSIRNDVLVDGFYPDFPNYGVITNKRDIEEFYKMDVPGNNIKMKSTIDVDRINNKIYIRDLPYNVTISAVKAEIKKQHEKKHAVLSKVLDIIEMKNVRDGDLHIEFEVIIDKNSNVLEVANWIDKLCTSKTIPLSFIMYDKEHVRRCNVKNIIENWYNTIYTTKVRKINFTSSNYNKRKHILEGTVVVYDHLDETIAYAKKSKSKADLIDYLSNKLKLTPVQAEAIANMSIHQLNNVSRESILKNIDDLAIKIAELDKQILLIDDDIINDLIKIKDKYSRDRRTKVIDIENEEQEKSGPLVISNGALLWSHNQYAVFDLQNLVNGKTLTNGLKTVKIDGKNTKEIIGCHNIPKDITGIIVFTNDGCAKRIESSDININNWITYSDEPVIVSAVPVFSDEDKIIILMQSGKMKIIESNQITKSSSKVGDVVTAQVVNPSKDYLMVLNDRGGYHFIKISDIPVLGRSAIGIGLNIGSDAIYITQIERDSDDTFITSLRDDNGVSYIMKTTQDEIEETNRVNKPKKLFVLEDGMVTSGINYIDIRNKDAKCVLIGPYSSSQISIQNIRTSDMSKIPKRIPVNVLGIVSYNI